MRWGRRGGEKGEEKCENPTPKDYCQLTAPALALTTSVPAFCMRSVSASSSSVVKLTLGVVCE